ncbi:MAG: efflux RND transporter permease subunit [Planctomycetota bacterium]
MTPPRRIRMDIIRFAISNPVKVTVGVILTVLFGVLSLTTIPIQLTPNVDEPVITIETNWTGRSPEEIEREIIEEQEEYLKSLGGLKKMTAEASTGSATITLEFFIGTDIKDARIRVSDKLREVPAYPDDVDEPIITDADADASKAIAWVIFDSTDPDFDMQSLYDFADDRVKPMLERVPGVSRINVYGGREREVHVRVDPASLAERGVTFNELRSALQFENVNVSAGDLEDGIRDVRVRTIGQFDALDQIENTVVRYDEAGPIRIKDLGDAVQTLEKRRSFVRANGQSALAINAIRETGSNVMDVMAGLREQIAFCNENILPTYEQDRYGLHMRQVYDETIYITDAINLVQSNLIIGGTLAALVLLVFLGKIRPTLIIALAIPVSVLGTFVVMTGAGRNLNVISLAGMAFAVGMVVDNAIVVLENIDRHIHMGKTPRRAAYEATKEVWGAILASTLTTLAVFIPVLTVQEEAGQLFFDISLAICGAVALSLIVSITVIPAASARWLRAIKTHADGTLKPQLADRIAGAFAWLPKGYSNLIHRVTDRGGFTVVLRILVIAAFTLASLGGAWLLMPPTSYLPNGNQNLIFGIMLTPPAYNIDQAQFIGERIEPGIAPYWEVDTIEEATAIAPVMNFQSGQPYEAVPPVDNYFFVRFGSIIFMGASSQDKELVQPLSTILTQSMMGIPGSFGFAFQRSIFGRGISGTSGIDVELLGSDLDRLRQSAEAVYMTLAPRYGFDKVQPDPLNFNLSGPEVQFRPDPIRTGDLSINTQDLGLAMRSLVDGLEIGDYRLSGESIDLLLTKHPDFELTTDQLPTTPLAVLDSDGQTRVLPISALGDFVPTTAPQQINRIDTQRSITFSVTPPPEVPLAVAVEDIENTIAELSAQGQIDPTVVARTAGSADKLSEVRGALLGNWTGFNLESIGSLLSSRMFLAVLIVFLVMAALFESFLYPLVILFAVPLATVGGFLGLAIMHTFNPAQQLDTLTMLGFVILIGVVVNNAILIVHQALNFMRPRKEETSPGVFEDIEPMEPREAIRESVRTRIRPIFMTTTTSVCGMLPLVLMGGSGSELYKGLGSVVVGGLLVATVFTLVVVPLLFSLVVSARQKLVGSV